MTFDAKDDAIDWVSARRAEIQMEVWAPAAAACAATGGSRIAGPAATRQQYRMILDTYLYPTVGDEPMDLISADDVNSAAHMCLSADCRPCA